MIKTRMHSFCFAAAAHPCRLSDRGRNAAAAAVSTMPIRWWSSFFILSIMLLKCKDVLGLLDSPQGAEEAAFWNGTELDCAFRQFAWNRARQLPLVAHEKAVRQVYEALQLENLCPLHLVEKEKEEDRDMEEEEVSFLPERRKDWETDTVRPARRGVLHGDKQQETESSDFVCPVTHCLFVNATTTIFAVGNNRKNNTTTTTYSVRTFETAHQALAASRVLGAPKETALVFSRGIHALAHPLRLDARDAGLTLMGLGGDDENRAWISGALVIPPSQRWDWDCAHNLHVRVANLTSLLLGRTLPVLASLFGNGPRPAAAPGRSGASEHLRRYTRARFPNANPEVDQWGYNSPDRLVYSLNANLVSHWTKPAPGVPPNFTYIDLRVPNPGAWPVKNDSTMELYNVYASGSGGVCADLWGPEADSYWCSNASAGGWAEVDQEAAVTGRLQIPVGLAYNKTSPLGRRFLEQWTNKTAVGGIVHAWHSQSWAMHMFSIASVQGNELHFAKGGGRQGGRNWCRCDQCTYAGPWCGQHQKPPVQEDDRLISGTWMVENLLVELDQPGEYFFDPSTKLLYFYPNATTTRRRIASAPIKEELRLALLETLLILRNTRDITIQNLGFRETAATYMSEGWSAPSGGDWALFRGGAVFLEDTASIRIDKCVFSRLDGSAVFLSRMNRDTHIVNSTFEWLGENAVALWGETKGFDATVMNFPVDTLIESNVFRELGIYEKQSSAVAQNKAARTTIRSNLMFNMARAAINFNDMMGGGDVLEGNVIFNTCRESGDHGPINTWDRQPFLTDLCNGTKSFVPCPRVIQQNFIMANYGASQGVDNDDGSSYYVIKENVFYDADGFKMDYGGHDSVFQDNLVVSYPNKRDPKCVGFGTFFPGHGHLVQNNICVVPKSEDPIIEVAHCGKDNEANDSMGHAILQNNSYYTPNGTAVVQCGYGSPPLDFRVFQTMFGMEEGSTIKPTPPNVSTIVKWADDILSGRQRRQPEAPFETAIV